MHCPHCENEIQSPSDQWHLNTPWHCSFCGGMFGIRLDGEVTFPLIPNMQPLAPLLGESIARRFAFYSKPNHYVYALCYSSGLPFYVGVGYGYRCFSHSTETKNERRLRWTEKHDTIQSLLRTSEGVWYHFLSLVQQRELAASIEGYWIRKWGLRSRGGILTNSVHPDTCIDEDDYQDQPPKIENDSETIKSFQHPDFIVAPNRWNATKSGAHATCFACGHKGQYVAEMRDRKVLCSNCGHFVIPWGGDFEDGSKRVFFGHEVISD